MKTKTKLIGLSCILSLMLALLAAYCVFGLEKVTREAENLYGSDLLGIHNFNQVNADILAMIREEKNIILADSEKDLATFDQTHAQAQKKFTADHDQMKNFARTENGQVMMRKFDDLVAQWLQIHDDVVKTGNTTDSEQSKKAQVMSATKEEPKAQSLFQAIEEMIALKKDMAKKQAEDIGAMSSDIRLISIVATICSVLIGVGLGVVIALGIVKQLGDEPGSLAGIAKRIADGDLGVEFEPGRPEIGVFGAMKNMVANLKSKISEADAKGADAAREAETARAASAVAEEATKKAESAKAEGMLQAAGQLDGVVEVVTSASEELSAQIEQSSKGSEEQAHRVSETATAMEEMNATVLEVARNASQAAETSDKARKKAQEGETIVGQVVSGIGQVQHQALELKADMGALGKQAQDIGTIMNVISDIADQTNLLALNAAIEAARAGDAGRGFAVVADEVRKLAEKTMTATKEVGEAISGIQSGARKNIDNVDRSVKAIEDATVLAHKSGDSLKEIVSLVDTASDQVRAIATASEQQSSASDEINRSIEQVAAISSQTAQTMTQAAHAVSEVARQTQVLQNLIGEMKGDAGQGSRKAQPAARGAQKLARA